MITKKLSVVRSQEKAQSNIICKSHQELVVMVKSPYQKLKADRTNPPAPPPTQFNICNHLNRVHSSGTYPKERIKT